MEDKISQLKQRLARVEDLNRVAFLLKWDQETYMPPGGAETRADQTSTLEGLAHQHFVDEEVGALLDDLEAMVDHLDYDSDEAGLIRFCLREYRKKVKLPTDLVMDISQTGSLGVEAWKEARERKDFSIFEPHLDKMIDLKMRKAEILGSESGNPYDALLDDYDPGMSYQYISGVFGGLKPQLTELVAAIVANQDVVDDSPIMKEVDDDKQMAICHDIAEALGYDINRGRIDTTAHPFTTHFSRDDVRITTRFSEQMPMDGIMSVIHEIGHGLYEQNTSPSLHRIPLANGSGMSVHESQSRFYENVVGRSRGFWRWWFPRLRKTFAPAYDGLEFETFYKALNRSRPSLMRVEADEVTYGLHIMLRFELENEIFNGKVKTGDLPREWNARMEQYLGVVPPDDSEGVLQDIHWARGLMGYFPDYLLGSIMSVQLWEAMTADNPHVEDQIEGGEYGSILDWQREKIHKHGRKFTFPELIERATGDALRWEPYMDYLREKYGEIYEL